VVTRLVRSSGRLRGAGAPGQAFPRWSVGTRETQPAYGAIGASRIAPHDGIRRGFTFGAIRGVPLLRPTNAPYRVRSQAPAWECGLEAPASRETVKQELARLGFPSWSLGTS